MNPKVFVFAAVAAFAVVIGVVLVSGSTLENLASPQPERQITQIEPIQVELDDILVQQISDRSATIEVQFKLTNPNPASIIIQVIDYQVYETDFSESSPVSGGQIGSRPEGMVEFGSNYFTLLNGAEMILKDKMILSNNGNIPELWSALKGNTAKWKVTGDIFYNLSSMTSGHENELHFEFTK